MTPFIHRKPIVNCECDFWCGHKVSFAQNRSIVSVNTSQGEDMTLTRHAEDCRLQKFMVFDLHQLKNEWKDELKTFEHKCVVPKKNSHTGKSQNGAFLPPVTFTFLCLIALLIWTVDPCTWRKNSCWLTTAEQRVIQNLFERTCICWEQKGGSGKKHICICHGNQIGQNSSWICRSFGAQMKSTNSSQSFLLDLKTTSQNCLHSYAQLFLKEDQLPRWKRPPQLCWIKPLKPTAISQNYQCLFRDHKEPLACGLHGPESSPDFLSNLWRKTSYQPFFADSVQRLRDEKAWSYGIVNCWSGISSIRRILQNRHNILTPETPWKQIRNWSIWDERPINNNLRPFPLFQKGTIKQAAQISFSCFQSGKSPGEGACFQWVLRTASRRPGHHRHARGRRLRQGRAGQFLQCCDFIPCASFDFDHKAQISRWFREKDFCF